MVILPVTLAPPGTIPARRTDEEPQHDGHDNPYLQHVLGDGQIERAHDASIVQTLVNLAVLRLVDEEALVTVAMVQL